MGDLDPAKILLVWIGRFGDLLVSGPFISALRARYPKAEITLLARAYVKDLAPLLPGLDRTIILPNSPSSALAYIKAMLPGFDICVDLNSSYSRTSGFLCLLSRAPLRASFDKFRAGWFYNKTAAAPSENEHMLSRYGRLAALFGAPYEEKLRVALPREAVQAALKLRDSLNLLNDAPLVLVHPGNFKKYDHRWPEEKFLELSRRLLDLPEKPQLALMAGPGEEGKVREMLSSLPGEAKYLPPQTAPVSAAFMSGCSLVIVSATGTMHLAAALDVPLLSFHSQYTFECWRPLNEKSLSLSSGEWNSCRSISVDAAWDAALKLLAKKP
ncbi:MAG: glycosyltransferase family 9 protein [Elusimicrobia bacterium]|nr:glycosyltransferase family 9 protein [Elusimicrobiota bacterium]